MQALILAAGCGRRLGGDVPKPLLEMGGKPILLRLIEQFHQQGISEIIVMLGYQAERIAKKIAALGVKTVLNPLYESSDNLVSFWVGQRHLSGGCLMSHADLVVEDELLRRILAVSGDVALPIDTASRDREAMKIKLRGGKIANLSKLIPEKEAAGESIPLMKFSEKAVAALKTLTDQAVADEKLEHYLESPILELVKQRRFQVQLVDVTGLKWIEIDTPTDLERAKQLFNATLLQAHGKRLP